MTRSQKALWPLGLAAGLAALALVLTSDHTDHAGIVAALTLLVGWSFVGVGLLARLSRTHSRMGTLMVVEGFAWLATALTAANGSVVFTIGLLVGNVCYGVLAHLLLAFPRGRLESRLARGIAGLVYLDVTILQVVLLLFYEPTAHDCAGCPSNALLVTRSDDVADALMGTMEAIGAVALLGIVAIFVQRWRAAAKPARRTLAPVLLTGGATLALLAAALLVSFVSGGASDVLFLVALLFLAAIPFAFAAGVAIARLSRLAVVRLLVELVQNQAPGRVRDALRRALRDPSLAVAYWLPETEGYVDAAGAQVALPAPGSGRAATLVEREGRRIGALIHDASLTANPDLLSGVSAAAGLALENARLQAELHARLEDLRASEARLRALIEASPLAIMEIDLEEKTTFWNPAAERLFGWTAEEAIGRAIPFLPGSPEPEAERRRQVLRQGESYSDAEAVFLRKDGAPVNVSISAAPVRNARGETVAFMGAVADITDRVRSQAELRRERDFISAVLDTASMLVIVTDRSGRFVRFNNACELITGYSFEEVRGRPYWELFVPPEETERVRQATDRVWAGQFPQDNDNHWIVRDGSKRLIAWSNTVLLDEHGEIEYMVSSGLDITERKRAEEEIRASRARIVEAGDAERRRLERNLHDGAQQRLVALSLALRMAYSRVRTSPEVTEQLLEGSTEELAHALNELRELARGIHPAVLTDRGLPAALEALAGRAPTPVEIEIDLGERLPPTIEAAAYYVVSEALANAAKYASATSVTVSVERANGYAHVEVADDGVGGADPDGGSGLRGLRDRIEALDGRLEVESRPGRGTRVRAAIPVAG